MSDFKPRPGTFRPYMEYAKREGLHEQPAAKASPLTLLEILSSQSSRALPMFDLQSQAGMDPAAYGEALKSLSKAGYITIEGEALDQVIQLTANGAEVVRLARPG